MMTSTRARHSIVYRCLLLLAACFLASCARAPSVDILGSFFPAWLVCLAGATLLTALVQLVLSRLHMKLALPVLVYPTLAVFFTLALWLLFYH
jgi:hypothetical protein